MTTITRLKINARGVKRMKRRGFNLDLVPCFETLDVASQRRVAGLEAVASYESGRCMLLAILYGSRWPWRGRYWPGC